MKRAAAVLWSATILASAGMVGATGSGYLQARGRAARELATLTATARQARELSALRSAACSWTSSTRPPTGLTPRISAALAASGLPATAMSSVSPETESPVGDSDLKARRSRAVLTLTGVTLPQLGGFLKAWRSREPQWTVSSLDLSLQGGGSKAENAGGGGGDLPLRVVVGLETLFVDRPEAAAPQAQSFVAQSGGAR